MHCPRCQRTLRPVTLADVEVDVCEHGCGGIWLDRYEIKKIDERSEALEHAGETLAEIAVDPDVVIDHEQRLECPKCPGTIMMRSFFSTNHSVEIDQCPSCAGHWLDCGELIGIRSQFDTEQEASDAAREYFDDLFGDELREMIAESAAQAERAQGFARLFRFICPSSYVPGKQDWAAF